MNLGDELSRETWFCDGKYLMRATAKFIRGADARRREVVLACALIFDGDPTLTNKPPLFISQSHLYSDSLESPLTEAERLGRNFIKTRSY
jgi:hypothetical protein